MGAHSERGSLTKIPEQIGPYRIDGVLGRGGMGIVYRAEHLETGNPVAVKTLLSGGASVIDGLRREIRALRRVDHPGVVRIVGDGFSDGAPWYAMELLAGRTFRDYLLPAYQLTGTARLDGQASPSTGRATITAGSPLGIGAELVDRVSLRRAPAIARGRGELLQLLQAVCEPLAHLHERGIVHQDLKPENIFIRTDGVPVLVDFGIAGRFSGARGREELDTVGERIGTAAYMAPEQIRGELVDARTDLYALGCILYECVVGEPPFFGMPPPQVRHSHLAKRPHPPSKLVEGVPPDLDRLIVRLLEKDPRERFAYASEVATVLDALTSGSVETVASPSVPPTAQTYLYRPSFVGRGKALQELRNSLRQLSNFGRGGLFYLYGESGVGKTRLAMEVVREATRQEIVVVLGQCSLLDLGARPERTDAPLHAFAPLLLAIADHCRTAGAAETIRVLGERGKLLAPYQAALSELPGFNSLPDPGLLDPQMARERIVTALADTLFAFTEGRNVLVVIDDLQWSDELSISFLQKLACLDFQDKSVLVVGTFRPEEASSAVIEFTEHKNARSIRLDRFNAEDTGGLVRGMFGLPESTPFVDFLHRQSDGNPFFIVEYLRAAITEGLLSRDFNGKWHSSATEQISVRLPTTLVDLIEQRLQRLSPSAREAGFAAAVLGRDADIDVIIDVVDLPADEAKLAISELIQRQILEHLESNQVRFAHDKLREVAYDQAQPGCLQRLHARAASSLEQRLPHGPDADRQHATLGHHYAMAEQPAPAARYFRLAAEHARATHAVDNAIALYREAIKNEHKRASTLAAEPAPTQLVALLEALADLLVVSGIRGDARHAYQEALDLGSTSNRATTARLYRKIGKTWELEHQHDQALRFYNQAQEATGDELPHAQDDQRHEWIQTRIEQVQTYYWLARVQEMDAIIGTLKPIVGRFGSHSQRIRFFHAQMQVNMRRYRYVANDETIALAKAAIELALEGSSPDELLTAHFQYGFALLFHHSLGSAQAELLSALTLARRASNLSLQARCLTYLTLAFRMAGDSESVIRHAIESEAIATMANMRDYVAVARANRAWYALREGMIDEAITWARDALEIWRDLAFAFPLQWTALLPLVEAELSRGNLEAAVSSARGLLLTNQQHIHGAATDAFAQMVVHWDSKRPEAAQSTLRTALELLSDSVYF